MSIGARLAAFALVLALAAGGGVAIGAAIGPEPDRNPPAVDHGGHDTDTTMGNEH